VGKFIPVEPEKWAEMVKAQAEVARLKAEVERLTSDLQMEKENEDRLVREWQRANNEVYGLQRQVAALIDDQTRLKAEVVKYIEEASNAQLKVAEVVKDAMLLKSNLTAENARLKSELDRLKGGRP
jgi:chromosome segregation ATPase